MVPADFQRDKTMLFNFSRVYRMWGENNGGKCLLIPNCPSALIFSEIINPLTPMGDPNFFSMDRTMNCVHSLESC